MRDLGTGIHYVTCHNDLCTGCLPAITNMCRVTLSVEPEHKVIEGVALGVTDEQRNDPRKNIQDMITAMQRA